VAALITSLQQPTTPAVCEETGLLRGFNTLGNFDPANQFTLVLIAPNGTETSLATTLTTSSSLLALLPPGLAGNGFRYRLRASSPLALSALSNTFDILPNPPAATISQSGFTLTSSVPQGNTWFKDGIAISGAFQQTYTVTENGEYSVRYSANNCQSPFSNSITMTNVSVVDQAHPGFRIFPNPVQELLQLVAPEAGHMQVRDLQGRRLMQQSLDAGNHELALSELAAGLYVLYWEDSRGTSLRRFVKQ
jgi:hypothetical protein